MFIFSKDFLTFACEHPSFDKAKPVESLQGLARRLAKVAGKDESQTTAVSTENVMRLLPLSELRRIEGQAAKTK